MTRAEHRSRLRAAFLGVAVALALAIAVVLLGLGIALLIAGLLTWVHPGQVASAWARTLTGLGLIGLGVCLAALGWPGVGWLRRIGKPRGETETALGRMLKFVAAVGILLALICLPFGTAIHAAAHVPWFGWER